MTAGVCQFCHVADDQVDGNKLCWHDDARTCCSKYACVKKYNAAKKAARFRAKQSSRFAELARLGWGRGAIYEQLRKEERARRRKKGKAA